MSADAAPEQPDWPPLSEYQQRVLGVLIEKAKTTSDSYPMTMNALLVGCNQKSNREPVMDLIEGDVEEALEELQAMGLVEVVQGGRVERWKHRCYEKWQVSKVEMAVLAELLLRGPQTEGELRGRASRMDPIESLEALREVLKKLAQRKLVVYLTPEGKRGTTVTHGFHPPEELEQHRARVGTGGAAEVVARPSSGELAELRGRVERLEAEVRRLTEIVAQLSVPSSGAMLGGSE